MSKDINRYEEMKICMQEQGYSIIINNIIHFTIDNWRTIFRILVEEEDTNCTKSDEEKKG